MLFNKKWLADMQAIYISPSYSSPGHRPIGALGFISRNSPAVLLWCTCSEEFPNPVKK